jgi:hypothetical protein
LKGLKEVSGPTKRVDNSLEVRLKGWRKALRSQRTPKWLKPAIKKNVDRLSKELEKKGN